MFSGRATNPTMWHQSERPTSYGQHMSIYNKISHFYNYIKNVQYLFINFHTIVWILLFSVYFISCCALCIIVHTWLKPRLQEPFCGPLFAIQTIWLSRAGCCRSDNSYINSFVSIPITSSEAFIRPMLYAAYICIIICASRQQGWAVGERRFI